MKILFALVVRIMSVATVVLALSFPAIADQTSKEIYGRIVAIDKKTDADSAEAARRDDAIDAKILDAVGFRSMFCPPQ